MSDPKEGDLRFWWCPQVGMAEHFILPVQSVEQAELLYDAFARYDLFQLQHRVKPDFCNAGGLEIFVCGDLGCDWEEWENQDGETLADLEMRDLEEVQP